MTNLVLDRLNLTYLPQVHEVLRFVERVLQLAFGKCVIRDVNVIVPLPSEGIFETAKVCMGITAE